MPSYRLLDRPLSNLVLVVDDDASVRTLLTSALRAKGYEVLQAADGLEAASLLGCGSRLPDLLVCDVMMPVIDGFSLVRLVKRRPELRELPVIFLTARAEVKDVARGINLGARRYVQKPFCLVQLLDTIGSLLQ